MAPQSIGEILSRDPDVLARVVLLASEVRCAQKSYFAHRSTDQALELLNKSKAVERKLDIALDAVARGQGALL